MSTTIDSFTPRDIGPAPPYHALEPSAPEQDASPPSYQENTQKKTHAATRKIFDSLCFLPSEKAANKKFWIEFSKNNILKNLVDIDEDGQSRLGTVAAFALACTVVPLVWAIGRYYLGQYMASQIVREYDNFDNWQLERAKASEMDFKTLVETYGLSRVRRLQLLGNTPEEGLKLCREKFDTFLKSDEVVARKWVSNLTGCYEEGHFTVVGEGTPWGGFISTQLLKDEGIIEKEHSDLSICYYQIPENRKRKIEVGRAIQSLNFQEFKKQFSERQLRREGALEHNSFQHFNKYSYECYQKWIASVIPEQDRLDSQQS